jgi:hypothetical protein
MDGARGQFLSGAAFADDEDRRGRLCRAGDLIVDASIGAVRPSRPLGGGIAVGAVSVSSSARAA